jgi:hypothetical protein
MQKIAFTASFLACFLTLDGQLFHGETTRFAYRALNLTALEAQGQIARLFHRR